jgi:hypothetical protein
MKIYTEEDLIKAIAFGFGVCRKEDRAPFNTEMLEFIGSLEPTKYIELPTDEEIEKQAPFSYESSSFKFGVHCGYLIGAKSIRDKIKGGNK